MKIALLSMAMLGGQFVTPVSDRIPNAQCRGDLQGNCRNR